jgi:hypothetical protein
MNLLRVRLRLYLALRQRSPPNPSLTLSFDVSASSSTSFQHSASTKHAHRKAYEMDIICYSPTYAPISHFLPDYPRPDSSNRRREAVWFRKFWKHLLRQLRPPSTLLLSPLPRPRHPISRHLCTTCTSSCITTCAPTNPGDNRHHPPSQIRARKAHPRSPSSSHLPRSRHTLFTPHSLLCPPLPLRSYF